MFTEMEHEARNVLAQSGLGAKQITVSRSADLRWVGQTHELTVQLPAGPYDAASRAVIETVYDAECRRLYGTPLRRTTLEGLTWRVAARGPRPRTGTGRQPVTGRSARTGERLIRLPGFEPAVAPVYDRYALPPGREITGPAIVEELESTCVIGPGDLLTVDNMGNLVVT